MQAHNSDIEEFLSAKSTVFVVPVYQRNYDWKGANCKQLFQDICHVVDTGNEHFLGTICFKVFSSHERSIIDGQQRLTSLSLMLKAMHDISDDEKIREEIEESYFYNKGHSIDTEYLKTKLHLNKRGDAVYRVLLDNNAGTIDANLTARQKESKVYTNYRLFYDLLQSYTNQGGKVGAILDSLCKLTIVELEIQSENPQEIFESLNSTGLDLTHVDLLRNYFLMQFSHQQQSDLYDSYWNKIEENVGVDHMQPFFVDYLVFRKRSDAISINGRRAHITDKTLYTAFKDYYMSQKAETDYEKTRQCFDDLRACSEIYRNFIFSPDVNVEKETPIRQKLYYLLGVNDTGKSRSLLLYLFNLYQEKKITSEMLNEALDAVSSLSFRAKLCKAKGINSQFAGNVMIRLDAIDDYSRFMDRFWEALTAGKGSYAFPTDEEFKQALVQKDIYQTLRSKGTKYLLYMLELHSPYHKGLPSFEDGTLSIEHIMPQTINDDWRHSLNEETLENYDFLVTRLGNLALTNYNSEMSNKSFSDKKKVYEHANFYYTKELSKASQWSSYEINKRSEKLVDAALQVWDFPKQYQKAKPLQNTLHTLDEDFTQFAYTKPSSLYIQDEEYSVGAWSDLLPIVCKSLIEEDKDAFLEMAHFGGIGSLAVSDDTTDYSQQRGYEPLTDNVFVYTAKSSKDTLSAVETIVKAFDEKTGSEYEDNIMFSLK